jgi:hypothetical protein
MRFVAALLAVLAAFLVVPVAAQSPAEGELPPEVA